MKLLHCNYKLLIPKICKKNRKRNTHINIFVFACNTVHIFYREIPKQGNTASIELVVNHRKFIMDEFLGMCLIYLKDFQPSSYPKQMVYKLQGRADGRDDKWKIQGEIHVYIVFKKLVPEPKASRLSPKGKSLWGIADELIKEKKRSEGLNRTSSIRSIALALMSEKKKAAAPLKEYDIQVTDTDDNDNEIIVKSARGRASVNTINMESSSTGQDPYHSTDSTSSNELLFEKVRIPTRERRSPQPRVRKLSNIAETVSNTESEFTKNYR